MPRTCCSVIQLFSWLVFLGVKTPIVIVLWFGKRINDVVFVFDLFDESLLGSIKNWLSASHTRARRVPYRIE